MRILVLGSNGFVGSSFVKFLKNKKKYKVFLASKSLGNNFTSYKQTYELIRKINPDIVYNLSAFVGSVHFGIKNTADIFDQNMIMLLNIFKAMRLCKPLLSIADAIIKPPKNNKTRG